MLVFVSVGRLEQQLQGRHEHTNTSTNVMIMLWANFQENDDDMFPFITFMHGFYCYINLQLHLPKEVVGKKMKTW